ncbi:MAG: response regulator transcription factor [Gemmataceae bacterium]
MVEKRNNEVEQRIRKFESIDEIPVQMHLPSSLHGQLERLKQSQGLTSIQDVVRNAIEAYVQATAERQPVQLTRRQREVLRLIGEGRTTKQIGDELEISIKTVEFHRKQLMKALGARRLADLVRCSIRVGLIQP